LLGGEGVTQLVAWTLEAQMTRAKGIGDKATIASLLRRLPGPVTKEWPMGEPFVQAMHHGTMSVEIYAPRSIDPQTPHTQDELYFIHSGAGFFKIQNERHAFESGTCFFVPAGVEHRFEEFTDDFTAWVVFWGPEGGEQE
jgi:mannose-6-phosphate isomerase-like protein (cupin superfamily)